MADTGRVSQVSRETLEAGSRSRVSRVALEVLEQGAAAATTHVQVAQVSLEVLQGGSRDRVSTVVLEVLSPDVPPPSPVEECRFPDALAYGAVGGPQFLTHIVDAPSGAEARQQQWPLGPALYDVSLVPRGAEETTALIAFFRCCAQGQAHSFRFRDFQPGESTGDYELLGYGDSSTTTFQLCKQYSIGGLAYRRVITKPVADTVVLFLADLPADPATYTVDHTTGLVTLTMPPALDVAVRASFEFDVWTRCTVDWLALRAEAAHPPRWTWGEIQLREVRPR